MPTAVFSLREPPNAASLVGREAVRECDELIRANLHIHDPERQRRILEMARSMSEE